MEKVYFAQEKNKIGSHSTDMRMSMCLSRKQGGDDKPDDKELRTIFAKNLAEGQVKLGEMQEAGDIHSAIK